MKIKSDKLCSSFLLKNILMVSIAQFLVSCSSSVKPGDYKDRTVSSVDVSRFMGKWYVIANIPNWFESGAHRSTESYSWNAEKKQIDVDFQYFANSFNGPEKHLLQTAYVFDDKTNAHWKIILYYFFKFDYLILDLAPDYSYTVVGVPNRDLLWIMARTPTMDSNLYQTIKEQMRNKGEKVEKLEMVPQVQ